MNVTPCGHLISMTVRGAWLLGQAEQVRKQWMEDRLKEFSQISAIEIDGFGLLESLLHLPLRLCPERVGAAPGEEVVRRCAGLFLVRAQTESR